MNYYNEFDPKAAAWLRELIAAGEIPAGVVDETDIRDVKPDDLRGYTQCHFFAGIGGWPLALRLAGWPDDRPVWTGSCPCQPFSAAGARGGVADERHLWPHWFHLIEAVGPAIVFGEQVASKDGLGWLDLVSADLEGSGYAFGAADLCAPGVGGPHIRQRLWFGAERMADADRAGPRAGQRNDPTARHGVSAAADREPDGHPAARPLHGLWRDADWLFCRDGKWRPVEPGTFPLAHGVSGRVGLLRGYGNAIVPPLAAEFILAFEEARGEAF